MKHHVLFLLLQSHPKGYLPIKTNGAAAVGGGRRRLSAEFEAYRSDLRQQPTTAAGSRRRQGGGCGPPPIVEVRLESNPELWSPRDTATFIAGTQARTDSVNPIFTRYMMCRVWCKIRH